MKFNTHWSYIRTVIRFQKHEIYRRKLTKRKLIALEMETWVYRPLFNKDIEGIINKLINSNI